MVLAEPANPPSRRAPAMWAVSAALWWLLPIAAQIAWLILQPRPGWLHLTVAIATAVLMALHIGVVPLWRYRVHRWEIGPQAAFTRSGWLIQQRRIAPISRVQTVDTYRGPVDRLFGLGHFSV